MGPWLPVYYSVIPTPPPPYDWRKYPGIKGLEGLLSRKSLILMDRSCEISRLLCLISGATHEIHPTVEGWVPQSGMLAGPFDLRRLLIRPAFGAYACQCLCLERLCAGGQIFSANCSLEFGLGNEGDEAGLRSEGLDFEPWKGTRERGDEGAREQGNKGARGNDLLGKCTDFVGRGLRDGWCRAYFTN